LSALLDPTGAGDLLGGRMVGGQGRPLDGGGGAAALLGRICLACVGSLPITGTAFSPMTASGHRGVVFATDDVARRLEDIQFTTSDGPGVDAFELGSAVLVPDLDGPTSPRTSEWPAFRETAEALGVRAVFAFPLRLGAASLGALTLYHLDAGGLDGPNLATAARLCDAASVALLDLIAGMTEGADLADSAMSAATDAEYYRLEIYQAAGMVMEQLGVSIEVAMIRLRSHAFATGRPTGEVAHDIVRRRLRLEADDD
jgi:ANTAR domain/GAF domain